MTDQFFQIPVGATVQFGTPANPLPQDIQEKIAKGIFGIPGVVEAHLPMCHVSGVMAKPAQILIVVVERSANFDSTMATVLQVVRTALFPETISTSGPCAQEIPF